MFSVLILPNSFVVRSLLCAGSLWSERSKPTWYLPVAVWMRVSLE